MIDPSELLHENLTGAGVAAALALKTVDPGTVRFETEQHMPLMLSQPDVKVRSLEHLLPAPVDPTIKIDLFTKEDLVAYLTAQSVRENGPGKADHPVIFANRNKLCFTAFIDFHRAGLPSWCRHSVAVTYDHSHQFKRWMANDNKKMSQEAFGNFLDENVTDILNPSGADVVTFATQLEVTRTERFKSATNLANGEVSFTFTNESSGDSTVKFPTEMTLSLPLWINGERIAIKAKLYYRVIQGELNFWYKLMMIEETIDHLFNNDTVWLSSAVTGLAELYRGPAPLPPSARKVAE